MTQPVSRLAKVTEVAWKSGGTDGRACDGLRGECRGDAAELAGREPELAGGVRDWPASTWRGCSTLGTTRGSATTASTITTAAAPADTAEMATWRALRRRARFWIRPKVPGGGCM